MATSYRRLQSQDDSRVHPTPDMIPEIEMNTKGQSRADALLKGMGQGFIKIHEAQQKKIKEVNFNLDYKEEIEKFLQIMDKNLKNTKLLNKKEEEIQNAIDRGVQFYLKDNEDEEVRKWGKIFDEISDIAYQFEKNIEKLENDPTEEHKSQSLIQLNDFQDKLGLAFHELDNYQDAIQTYQNQKQKREERLEAQRKDEKESAEQPASLDPGKYQQRLEITFEEFKKSKQKVELSELNLLFDGVISQIQNVQIKKPEEGKIESNSSKQPQGKQDQRDRNKTRRQAKDGLKYSAQELVLVFGLFNKHFMKLVESQQPFQKLNGQSESMDHLVNFKFQERPPEDKDSDAFKFITKIVDRYEATIKKINEFQSLREKAEPDEPDKVPGDTMVIEQEIMNIEKQNCEKVEKEIELLKKLPIAGELINQYYNLKKNLNECLQDQPDFQTQPDKFQTKEEAESFKKFLEYDLVDKKWIVFIGQQKTDINPQNIREYFVTESIGQHWRFFADGSYVSDFTRNKKQSQWNMAVVPDTQKSDDKSQTGFKIVLNLEFTSNEYNYSCAWDWKPKILAFNQAPGVAKEQPQKYKDKDIYMNTLASQLENSKKDIQNQPIFKWGQNDDSFNGYRISYFNFKVIQLKIFDDLKKIRELLHNYEEKFKSSTKGIEPINMFINSLLKSWQEDWDNHQIKLKGINHAAAKFDLEPLFNFCQVSETQNLDHCYKNIKNTGAIVSHILSDETYRLNLFSKEEKILLQDIISIDDENDNRFEFLLLFRKYDGAQASLFTKRFSFTDYSVQKNSEVVQITGKIQGRFWASTWYAEYLSKKDKFFPNKFLIYGNINDPDGDNSVFIIELPCFKNKFFQKRYFQDKINETLKAEHEKSQTAGEFTPINIQTTYTYGKSTLLLRDGQIIYIFEIKDEDENCDRFYYAVFDVITDKKDDNGQETLDINCICAKPFLNFQSFRQDQKFWVQNPIFLSSDLLCLEIHKQQRQSKLPDSIVLFEVERDPGNLKALKITYMQTNDIEPSPKPQENFWVESIDASYFAVFTEKKVEIYEIQGKSQVSRDPIHQISCDQDKKMNRQYQKIPTLLQSQIIGTETECYQGFDQQITMKNYLYWCQNQRVIKKVPCHSLGKTFTLFRFKNKKDEQLFASLWVTDNTDHLGRQQLSSVNFSFDVMNFKGIKQKNAKKVYNNFFVNFEGSEQNQKIETGIISPYCGTFTLAMQKWTDDQMTLSGMDIDDQGQVAIVKKIEGENQYSLKIFDSIDLQYSWEVPLDLKSFLKEEDEKIEKIKFGKYGGPLLFLITNKQRIVALSSSVDPENELPKIMEVLKPNEDVKDIQFAPNMKWVILKKEDKLKHTSKVVQELTNNSSQRQILIENDLKKQEKNHFKSQRSIDDEQTPKESKDTKEEKSYEEERGIDHIQFSEFYSTKDDQNLLIVYNKRFKKFNLDCQTTELELPKDKKEQSDEGLKDSVQINSLNYDQDFPVFELPPEKQNEGCSKILEIKPFDHNDNKFILMLQNKEEVYFFNLQDMTVRNHCYFRIGNKEDQQLMDCYIDCFNNIIFYNSDCFRQVIDLDNTFCQKINQQSALHTIRFFVSNEKVQRQFFKTYVKPDKIFKPKILSEFNEKGLNLNKANKDKKEENRVQQQSAEEEDKNPSSKKAVTAINIHEFISELNKMTNEAEENIEITQDFKFRFPKIFLDILLFGKINTQTVNFVEKVEFKELVQSYRQFANMNPFSVFMLDQPVVESILSKHDSSNQIVFYKQSKIWMDLDYIMDQQAELNSFKKCFEVEIEKEYTNLQQIIQLIIDKIGFQHDQLTQLYFSEKLFKTQDKRYQDQCFDFKHIKFTTLLDSKLVMNDLSHNAIPSLFKDQQVLIDLKSKDDNLFDKYFKPLDDKNKICSLPGNLDLTLLETGKGKVVLDPDQKNNQELVQAKFYLLSVQNLIEYNFISQLFFNTKQGDESLYQSIFVKNFIDYSWEKEVGDVLKQEITLIVVFIIVHFTNMLYLEMDSCGPLSVPDCVPRESIFAIENGRKHIFTACLGYVQIFMCAILIYKEVRDVFHNAREYKNQWVWNTVDCTMPISFLVGYYYDTESVGTGISRVAYTVTTINLMFVLFQKLKLTKKFSFMVVCIIACISKMYEFVLFLFVLLVFLTVSYTNLGYTSPLTEKFNIYIANFFSMFKMAMGESQTEENEELEGILYYTSYILFVFFAFFTTIVYMNILIAVVNDEFEKVFEERALALYKIRLPYIINYWQTKPDSIIVNNCVIIIPDYNESKEQWTGWISVVKKQLQKMKFQMQQVMDSNQKELKELITKTDQVQQQKDKDLTAQIVSLQSQMSSELKVMKEVLIGLENHFQIKRKAVKDNESVRNESVKNMNARQEEEKADNAQVEEVKAQEEVKQEENAPQAEPQVEGQNVQEDVKEDVSNDQDQQLENEILSLAGVESNIARTIVDGFGI